VTACIVPARGWIVERPLGAPFVRQSDAHNAFAPARLLRHVGRVAAGRTGRRVIETVIEDSRWAEAGLEPIAMRAADAALAHVGLDPADWEIALLACDDDRIAALNADFRGKPRPTNVLSWPSDERAPETPGAPPAPPDPGEGPELGDIAIAWETCVYEATEAGVPFEHHVTHLLVHGTLHLLGYDHVRDADAELMERIEVEVLASLGIPNPY
jgi:probable rRNA maturation factor